MIIDGKILKKKIIDAINVENNNHVNIDIMVDIDCGARSKVIVSLVLEDRSVNYKHFFVFAMDVKNDKNEFEDYVVRVISDDYLKYAETANQVNFDGRT